MNVPLAPLAAAVLGGAAAAACALLPTPMLEGLVMDSGLPAVLAAAEPPLGFTARMALAAGAGGLVAVFGWLVLFLVLGTRGLTLGRAAAVDMDAVQTPVLRRADAHPDAPPRPPLLATRDLGTPFLEVTARSQVDAEVGESGAETVFAPDPEPVIAQAPEEQELPIDLEQPLAAFDPDAIPQVPMPPPAALAPLRPVARPAVFDTSERFETFELTPIRRTPPPPRLTPAPREREEAITRPETEATIHALLDRLEKGVVKRGIGIGAEAPRKKPRDAERGLEEALVTLRNLARRA